MRRFAAIDLQANESIVRAPDDDDSRMREVRRNVYETTVMLSLITFFSLIFIIYVSRIIIILPLPGGLYTLPHASVLTMTMRSQWLSNRVENFVCIHVLSSICRAAVWRGGGGGGRMTRNRR